MTTSPETSPPAFSVERYQLLLALADAIVPAHSFKELLEGLACALGPLTRSDYFSINLHDRHSDTITIHGARIDPPSQFRIGTAFPVSKFPAGQVINDQKPLILSREQCVSRWPLTAPTLERYGVETAVLLPLSTVRQRLGVMGFYRCVPDPYHADDVSFLALLAHQVALAVENVFAFEQIDRLKSRLAQEKLYLEDEVRSQYDFDEIVGQSAPLIRVMEQVRIVADTDATVLVCGETGTGKELIARALHHYSGRKSHVFVKLNCAAVPATLLESELFGHEKGAFTSAVAQRIGRFEVADNGTLFLDEVGDLPLELQPKLLRVLQEQEFERVGGSTTIRTNVRVVAATNRDLPAMVAAGTFRGDLYYRLNVFPIHVPPLRDRLDDIPLLVPHFIRRAAHRIKKPAPLSTPADIEALQQYSWPGNLRELQNLIERAVILSRGQHLEIPLPELIHQSPASSAAKPNPALTPPSTPSDVAGNNTLDSLQRDHIVRILREARWVIGGPRGAAARLGIKRTTLQSRMRKLGIHRPTH